MNKKIRVLIVDDEPLARRGVFQLLEPEPDFVIAGEAGNGREAVSLIETLAPDLVFLDINMPLLDGFSFLEKISADDLPEIVFVTAYDEHAIRAFEAGAIDYVLKPINAERFQKTLERIRRRIFSGENKFLENKLAALINDLKSAEENYLQRIAVKKNGRINFLEAEKIERICSQGNYIEIYAEGKKYLLRETMDNIEAKLNPKDFVRIRRSTIVRISAIKELLTLFNGEYAVILNGGEEISSSRRYRKNLENLLKM